MNEDLTVGIPPAHPSTYRKRKPKVQEHDQSDLYNVRDRKTNNLLLSSETFEGIYLDLSRESGKCRFAETGFGWKPSAAEKGGASFTCERDTISNAQWSRAAKGM